MADSVVSPNSSLYSSLVLATFLSCALSSYSTKIVTVEEICSKHTNPSFCARVLNSKPGGAAGADLASLGQHAISVADVDAFEGITLIDTLIGNTSEAQLKKHYISCSVHYDDALRRIIDAKKALSSADYSGMDSAAATAKKDVEVCDSEPVADPSSLPSYNKEVENVALIVVIIAEFLGAKPY